MVMNVMEKGKTKQVENRRAEGDSRMEEGFLI